MSEMELYCDQKSDEQLKKNKIKMYKSILNYYRGKSLSLEIVIASKQPSSISSDMKKGEFFIQSVDGLFNDITLLHSLRDCVRLMKNSLTYNTFKHYNNFTLNRSILNKVEGITYISKSIMQSFNDRYSEFDIIEKKRNYAAILAEYAKKLDILKENQRGKNINQEEAEQYEKAEVLLYKVNLIRAMKAILIGYISVSHPDLLPLVDNLRTPDRRNLTLEDFKETWDIGYHEK